MMAAFNSSEECESGGLEVFIIRAHETLITWPVSRGSFEARKTIASAISSVCHAAGYILRLSFPFRESSSRLRARGNCIDRNPIGPVSMAMLRVKPAFVAPYTICPQSVGCVGARDDAASFLALLVTADKFVDQRFVPRIMTASAVDEGR
jgi:hypothetical protein